VITIGASILAGVIYGKIAVSNIDTLGGLDKLGGLIWAPLITLFVVGPIMNAVMTKLLPRKSKPANSVKEK
jgi:hypothetical protein